jgi:phosphatidylserine decarboxylase
MVLTRYGRREWLGGGIAAAVLVLLGLGLAAAGLPTGGFSLAGAAVLAWCCLAAFFRDPRRMPPPDPELLVSPADGRVRDIELITDPEVTAWFGGGNAVRIGIFLSVLDVHLNRAPCDLTVRERLAREGVCHDARDVRAIALNEAVTIIGEGRGPGGAMTVAVRQISGAIARRIVCEAAPGTVLTRGERYGMIKFGSRTELYLPAGSGVEVLVRVGDRVQGGHTPLARWRAERRGEPT